MPKKPRPDRNSPEYEALRPYIFHGLDLNPNASGEEVATECPFCGKDKFNVNKRTTLFRCWSGSCGVEGNSSSFIRQFWELCHGLTTEDEYQRLVEDSGFFSMDAAKKFGVARNTITGEWIVPGFNASCKMTGLYRFARIKDKKGKWVSKLLPTPGTGHHLFNLQNYEPEKPIIDLCEGWRDGIAWIEMLQSCSVGDPEDGVTLFSNRNVVCVPGTNSFKPSWTSLFKGKTVNILFDNDYSKRNNVTGNLQDGAGLKGVKKVASILLSNKEPPEDVYFLRWGNHPEGWDDALADGMDLRDFMNTHEPTEPTNPEDELEDA